MAKKSKVVKQEQRERTVLKYAAKRAKLKEIIRDPRSSEEQKQAAQQTLQSLPRNASPVRLRNRCAITGRPHGFYRKFGIARNKLREATMLGEVPGVRKASW